LRTTRHEAEPASMTVTLGHPSHTYIRWTSLGPNHDALCASNARLRSSGAHSTCRLSGHVHRRAATTSDRSWQLRRLRAPKCQTLVFFLLAVDCWLVGWMQFESCRDNASVHIVPKDNDELAGQRHDHQLARFSVLGALFEPLHQSAVGLEHHHPPS